MTLSCMRADPSCDAAYTMSLRSGLRVGSDERPSCPKSLLATDLSYGFQILYRSIMR